MLFKKKIMPNNSEVEDAIKLLQQGSAEAFQILYKNYADAVYRFCLKVLGSPELAEDAFQEVFIVIYEKRKSFRGNNFASWLFTITRNTCINQLRKSKDLDKFDETFYPHIAKFENRDLALKEQIDKAIAELPLALREAIVLREYDDLSYQEISEVLGIDLALVKVRIHRARLILRKVLKPIVKEFYES